MRDRSLLHVSRIEAFTSFATARGYRVEPTKGAYEVLRLRKDGEPPVIFHKRDRGDHLTAAGEGLALARAFVREGKVVAS